MRGIATLQHKVTLTLFGAVILALLTSATLLTVFEYRSAEARARLTLETLSDTLASSLVASIDFEQATVIESTLRRLSLSQAVLSATVLRHHENGEEELFARHIHEGKETAFPPEHREAGFYVVGDRALLVTDLYTEGRVVGHLQLEASTDSYRRGLRETLTILATVFGVVALSGLILSRVLQRVVTKPVIQLAETAAKVRQTGDFTLRADPVGRDEVGELTETFNAMLASIAVRDKRLAESAAFQRAILEATEVLVICVDVSGVIVLFNPAAERVLGFTAAEVIGKATPEIWHDPKELVQFAAEVSETLGLSIPPGIDAFLIKAERNLREAREWTYVTKRGDRVPVFLHVSALRAPNGQITGYCGLATNLTEQKTADAALRASEAQYRSLIEEARDAIFTLSADGRILEINQAVDKITGWPAERLIGRSFTDPLQTQDREIAQGHFAAVMRGEHPPPFELKLQARDGHWITFEFAVSARLLGGKIIGVLGVGRDITERRLSEESRGRLEKQLQQAQKMEAIGTLAGGIAHDFNNILAGITGYTSLALQKNNSREELDDYLNEIDRATKRATGLVRQILSFSRADEREMKPLDLAAVVTEAVHLLRAAIPATIEFSVAIAPGLASMRGNETQLHQVIMNLGTNAWHAIGDEVGVISLQLEHTVLDLAAAQALSLPGPGPYLRLRVSDSGSGMDAVTQARVFEPFFTTKAPGEGTGLGLSVVHGIVRSHQGAIQVESEVGRGSTFTLCFPELRASSQAIEIRPDTAPHGRRERILLVDDEESLIRLGVRTLQQLDYEVEGVGRAREALERVTLNPNFYQLIITDQTMPLMTGLELAAEVHKLNPHLPIILASGYSTVLTPDNIAKAGIRGVLQKPYSREALARIIREHLGPSAP